MRRGVLATRNGHKVRELRTILADLIDELDLEIVGMGEFPDVPDVVETGVTVMIWSAGLTLSIVLVGSLTDALGLRTQLDHVDLVEMAVADDLFGGVLRDQVGPATASPAPARGSAG